MLSPPPCSSLCPRLLCSADPCPRQSHPGVLSPVQARSWPCLLLRHRPSVCVSALHLSFSNTVFPSVFVLLVCLCVSLHLEHS
ncbi:hypothetical protein CgunFtcFv8_014762 [Champsocephalus gunnari]|uniref:Uncharacterized protein n=1 Tax=Champsocephalus gunnari TaxID=52237 RepID=A0AAN8I080_CHAGU|nr:hypothetical protein CgunFtcFv8_014762 [Champsocephalus gunnari]